MGTNAQSTAAHERARNAQVIVVRVTPRRYSIARLSGVGAYGLPGRPNTMIGIQTASILKECSNLTYDEMMGWMYKFDIEHEDPWEYKTV